MKKELKKRRYDHDYNRRTKKIAINPIPGHRYPLAIVQFWVLMYMRTNYGLLTVVKNPTLANESVTKTFNFKERLCNVKLKDLVKLN